MLLVANKYQTGFDQPKLCAMYVLKKLRGVNAVQTLSRLNRICAPYDKKTFVLDFVNTYEDIKAAFAPYYTTTLLANSVTPNAIYDLEATIDAYALFDPADIEAANDILYSQKVTGKQKQRLTFFLQKSKKLLEHYEYETQRQAVADMRGFVRYYEFLLQVSSFEDTDLHKKYNFISYLLAYINIKHPGGGFNLDGKIKASQFVQKKGEEHVSSDLVAKPVMKLPTAEHFGLSEDKEKRLSEIIDEINSKTGKNYDNDVVVKAMLQIRDILLKKYGASKLSLVDPKHYEALLREVEVQRLKLLSRLHTVKVKQSSRAMVNPYLLFLYLRRLFVTEILKDRTILHTLAASL